MVTLLFCGYIGFDYARAQTKLRTVDNAIDSASELYVGALTLEKGRFISELRRVFGLCGLEALLNETAQEQLFLLAEHLVAENAKYNLTAVTDPDGIILRHFAGTCAPPERGRKPA